ncbi:hypothetical protein [Acinetobacter sp. ANC 3832]|uniref:hypothetical protein n=1 Tax=Acinetobacter sp. ANC 3832 TaxID=1977874 RepID=UPI00111BF0C4|nr:hypothetical protein [Acinetobacter sp. ANC 3832]
MGAIRNTNLQAVAVAGYGPYIVAGSIEAGGAVAPILGSVTAKVATPIVSRIAPYMQSGATLARAEGVVLQWLNQPL